LPTDFIDEILSDRVEDIQHDKRFVAETGVTMGDIRWDAIKITLHYLPLLLANAQDCAPTIDHADLLVWVSVNGHSMPWKGAIVSNPAIWLKPGQSAEVIKCGILRAVIFASFRYSWHNDG
jgi:hypothetical protein